MEETRELYTLKEGTKSLKEYVIPATGRHLFEVKDRDKLLYEGGSYQRARSLYEELCRD